MDDGYPRVLIVSPAVVNRHFGGGVTLGKLFMGWPRDRLAQVHSAVTVPDTDVCDRLYSVAGPFVRGPLPLAMRRMGLFLGWALAGREHGLIWARLSHRLLEWVEAFQPEVVFSQTGSLGYLRLTRAIVDATDARLVLHVSDDWPNDWPTNQLGVRIPVASNALARRVNAEFRALVDRANARMVISGRMSEEYAKRYGHTWSVYHNAVDLAQWPYQESFTPSGQARFLYSGSVFRTARPGLRDLAEAVSEASRSGLHATLTIATHATNGRANGIGPARHVMISGMVPPADLPRHLASHDVLVLVSPFERSRRSFLDLSLPGKLAEYLASGTPILAYGPRGSALIDYLGAHECAFLATEPDISGLATTVRAAALDGERRRFHAQRARALAERDFDVSALRSAFQSELRSVSPR